MKEHKVPFPKYLNSKKLFYRWEYDIVISAVISFISLFIIMLWVAIPVIVALLVAAIVSLMVMKKYEKFFKKTRKGYLVHFAYSQGFIDPYDKKKIKKEYEEDLIPMGFMNEFKD